LSTLTKSTAEKNSIDDKLNLSNAKVVALLEAQKKLDDESEKFSNLQTENNREYDSYF